MKLRWKILFALLVAGVLGTLFLIRSHAGSKQAVAAYIKQLRDRGEKLTIAELIPRSPTNGQNGAPAFLAATNLFFTNGLPPMMRTTVIPGRARVAWRQDPLPADGLTNIWPVAHAELLSRKQEMQLLRDIVRSSEMRFDLDYSKGVSMSAPHLPRLKGAEILAAAATMTALHGKDYAEAWEDLNAAVALLRIYQPEPLIISHLVRASMASIAVQVSWEALTCDQWTDRQLSQLQLSWEAMDFFGPLEKTMPLERIFLISFLREARRSRDLSSLAAGTFPPNQPAGPAAPGVVSSLINSPRKTAGELYARYPRFWAWQWSWSYDEELFGLKVLAAGLETIQQTKLTGAFVPALKQFDLNTTNLIKMFSNSDKHFQAFGMNNDSTRKYLIRLADIEVGRRLLVTAIALRRYQMGHGRLPEHLNELVPEFLTAVPIDLMDGKPLRYQLKTGETFLLYSVGEDAEDNGGDPANSAKYWLKARDAVWPTPTFSTE